MSDLALDRQLADRINAPLLAAETLARKLLEKHRDVHHEIASRLKAVEIDELWEMSVYAADSPSQTYPMRK